MLPGEIIKCIGCKKNKSYFGNDHKNSDIWFCDICKKNPACNDCLELICEKCEKVFCKKCKEKKSFECVVCGDKFCDDCCDDCERCEFAVCNKCSYDCNNCEKWICKGCVRFACKDCFKYH